MQIIWTGHSGELADRASSIVADLVARHTSATIALPTGTTPLPLYARLVALCRDGVLELSRARFFNLDELGGKAASDRQSYAQFLNDNLFGLLGASCGSVRLLRGDAAAPEQECREYEAEIQEAGGLDLAVLGLGRNGHIAFNEPGSAWTSRTRCVALTETTRKSQGGLFASPEDVPRWGLTVGIATISEARTILLIVDGEGKEQALQALLRAIPDPQWPVTALLDHPDLTVIVGPLHAR